MVRVKYGMGARKGTVENMVSFSKVMDFYKGKRVLVTGHTGFKGTWLWTLLEEAGAILCGYSLPPTEELSLYKLCGLEIPKKNTDIGDFFKLNKVFSQFQPEIVFHLAAQALVSKGYENPLLTYETNVMGTVHVMECCRLSPSVQSVVNVTTDKVYENKEWVWGYREQDTLNGYDPYSNSKSCSELVTASYRRSFLSHLPVSTVRAGNVIGGGDFSPKRLLPDCIRAAVKHQDILIRNPHSIRPFQHVLDGLFAYLLIAKEQCEKPSLAGAYNVGLSDNDCRTTGEMVDLFCHYWGGLQSWCHEKEENPAHEATALKLDCSLLKNTFQWVPVWTVEAAVEKTCQWAKVWAKQGDVTKEMLSQIKAFGQQQEQIAKGEDT